MKKLIITLFALSVMSMVSSASLTKEQTESLNEKIKEYDYVGSFSENRALVIKDNKAGFINKSGDVVIPLQYENVVSFRSPFRNGLWCDESVGVIDSMGNRLVPEGKVKRILQVPQGPFREINKFPGYKSLNIVQIETEPGKTITYCFEFGKLLFTMDNDWPVVNYYTGKILSTTQKKKKKYLGEEDLKKLGFQDVSNVYHCGSFGYTTGECLVLKKNDKFGIVDMNFKEVYPFVCNNSHLEYVDGTVLVNEVVYHEDGDLGLMVFPFTTSIYKDKKVLANNLFCTREMYGKYVFFEGGQTSFMDYLEQSLGIKTPESAKKIKLYTLDGKEVESIAFGQNRFRLVDKEGVSSWIYEDAKGNAIIKEPVELVSGKFGEKVIAIQTASSIQNGLEIFIDIATGDTAWFPESAFCGMIFPFPYLEAGLIKVSDLSRYDYKYSPLTDYYVTSSRRDNELNLKFMRREEYDDSTRKSLYKIKNTETNKLIEKEFQQIDSFSDELLLVRFNNRWYFLNDEGEGIK
ncbi:MAG: WG repeat-containing protein [Paludibacteraceae bacterium]|nr:WG repeat-containing protein [Paludibacteraceae bacterium]